MREPQNFRDVGATINALLSRSYLAEQALFRGGKFLVDTSREDIGNPATVVNLRVGRDPVLDDVTPLHFPTPNTLDAYAVVRGANIKWLVGILNAIAEHQWPVYIHCAAGKDRTGIVVGAILTLLGVPAATILDDYELSDGLLNVRLFRDALDAFAEPGFFRKVKVEGLRRLLSG